ncbi:MAG: ATP-binding protein [Bacteroidales bacterium]|nr:ATP-binding protein [Bacteroidales bacterium]
MRTSFLLISFISGMLLGASLYAQEASTEMVWETDKVLSVPESVLPTERGFILVSNIDGKPTEKDGKGFISMLGEEGEVIDRQWCSGLDAPKGMTIAEDMLYVTNIDQIVKINLDDGRIITRIQIEGARFLNDLCTLHDGRIACTDMQTGQVHILQGDRILNTFSDTLLKRPNGLAAYEGEILVGCSGYILRMNPDNGALMPFMDNTGPVDGLVVAASGIVVVSDWSGKVQLLREGMEPVVLLDHTDEEINAADLGWDERHQRLLVPTFFDNRVRAYLLQY